MQMPMSLSDDSLGMRASKARAFAHLGRSDQRQEGEGKQVSRPVRIDDSTLSKSDEGTLQLASGAHAEKLMQENPRAGLR